MICWYLPRTLKLWVDFSHLRCVATWIAKFGVAVRRASKYLWATAAECACHTHTDLFLCAAFHSHMALSAQARGSAASCLNSQQSSP
eukprot:6178596-Pleurochrysis_carterae.AAC.2